jgi:hypothetical protein
MIRTMRRLPTVVTAAVALLAAVTLTAGCSSDSDASTAVTTTAASPPDVVGSWEGSYQFPTLNGVVIDSPLLVVVEQQEGTALWGYEQFDDGAQVIRIPFVGSFDADGQSFGLAATGLSIIGTMSGVDQMNLRFFRVADPPTSFQVLVERTSDQR